jgi:uncharacterized damage-inducible protein DinB
MKEVLSDLASYHLWADRRLLEAISKLPPEVPEREVESSFPSLRLTFEHMLWSEQVWLQRLQMAEKVHIVPQPDRSFNELGSQLIHHNERVVEWIKDQKDIFFDHIIAYYNSKKQYYKQPVYQCLLQLFNHATYHRGQIVTMLHELKITKIPATDYIVFKRTKK